MYGVVAHNRSDPHARARLVRIVGELLEHDERALLQSVVGDIVVAGHASRQRQKPAPATADPSFEVALEQGTGDGVLELGTRGG